MARRPSPRPQSVIAGLLSILLLWGSLVALPVPARAAMDYAKQVLIGADFSNTDMRGVTFNLTNLRDANLAGADLRQAFRVLARLEPELPRPRVVARLEELDEYVGGSEILKELVAFAASPTFGQLLANAVIAEP